MIKAENLKKDYTVKKRISKFKYFKTVKTAVQNISLEIEQGKIIGLLGTNGAGKTTTIKLLTTMLEPTSGCIFVDGINAIKEPMKIKKKINLISGGERNIYWRLTAKENLEYFGRLYGIGKADLKERIENVLNIVDLKEEENIPVEKYSKGMKQRLQIARGLINNPDYIFLDEPTLGLDIVIADELRKYIKKLAQKENKGILLTTHYIAEAEELCDYIYLIDNGSVLLSGNADYFKQSYTKHFKATFEVSSLTEELLAQLKKLQLQNIQVNISSETPRFEVISKNEITGEIIDIIEKSKCKLQKVITMEPTLEEAILNILGRKNNVNVN